MHTLSTDINLYIWHKGLTLNFTYGLQIPGVNLCSKLVDLQYFPRQINLLLTSVMDLVCFFFLSNEKEKHVLLRLSDGGKDY